MMNIPETDQWDEIYQKVCDKVLISGNGQDFTFTDYIADKYPDLVMASEQIADMRDIQQQSTDRQMHFTHSRLTG